MLSYLPNYIPPLDLMLDDLGAPTAAAVAAALDVTPKTVQRWTALGVAPRPVSLALFWLTRWGQSTVDCKATNDARHFAAMARCYVSEIRRLEDEVRKLHSLGDFGCANDTANLLTVTPSESTLQMLDSAARPMRLAAVPPR